MNLQCISISGVRVPEQIYLQNYLNLLGVSFDAILSLPDPTRIFFIFFFFKYTSC